MDAARRVELAMRPPTEEAVTEAELAALFASEARPSHYIGIEVSGFLHAGTLLSTGRKIADLSEAGVSCTVFLADWHTAINDKLGGDMGDISRVAAYYERAFAAACPGARVLRGSDLYRERPEYWSELVRLAGRMSLARTLRALTIMGRSEGGEGTDLAKLLYPAMQALDVHFLDVDIAHAGMDQRRVHMLARDAFPGLGWKVPVALHHSLLPSLAGPSGGGRAAKMSKSDPRSGILMHDSEEEVLAKVSGAWCEAGAVEGNPLLAMCRQVLMAGGEPLTVERPERFGGDEEFASYAGLEAAYAAGKVHPADLKGAVGRRAAAAVAGVASRAPLDEEAAAVIRRHS